MREIGGRGRKKRELSSANRYLEGFSLPNPFSLNSPFVNKRVFFIFWSKPTGMLERVFPYVAGTRVGAWTWLSLGTCLVSTLLLCKLGGVAEDVSDKVN